MGKSLIVRIQCLAKKLANGEAVADCEASSVRVAFTASDYAMICIGRGQQDCTHTRCYACAGEGYYRCVSRPRAFLWSNLSEIETDQLFRTLLSDIDPRTWRQPLLQKDQSDVVGHEGRPAAGEARGRESFHQSRVRKKSRRCPLYQLRCWRGPHGELCVSACASTPPLRWKCRRRPDVTSCSAHNSTERDLLEV